MHRFTILLLALGCSSNSKDTGVTIDSGLSFPDTDGGDETGGDETGGEETGGEETGGEETGGEETGETGDETGGETGETGDETGGETGETGGETGDETGGETGGETGEDPEEDCTDAPLDIFESEEGDEVADEWGDRDGTEFEIGPGYLYPSTDEDRFSFTVTDGWVDGWDVIFDVQASISGVEGVDFNLELWHMSTEDGEDGYGLVSESNEGGVGAGEEVSVSEFELTAWTDRGGLYEVRVSSVGDTSNCMDSYTLTIGADTR